MARVYNPTQSSAGKIDGSGTCLKQANGQTVLQPFQIPVHHKDPAQLAQAETYHALKLVWDTLSTADKATWKFCSAMFPRYRLDGSEYQLRANIMFAACGARRIALGLQPVTNWQGRWFQPDCTAVTAQVDGSSVDIDWEPAQAYIYHVEIYLQRLQAPTQKPDTRFWRLQGRPESWIPPFTIDSLPPGFYAAWGHFLDPRDGNIGTTSPPTQFTIQGE